MASRRLEVVIAGDASGATRALGQVENRAERTGRSLGGLRRIGGALAGVFAGVQVGQFLRGAIEEAEEAQRVMAQTNAVIESTGGVAGISADHLNDLAGELSRLAAVDGEVIQQGGNLLLTFKEIKAEGGIFDGALAAALDMSSALGTQLQPQILAVGKALNDPIRGITRLERVGVSFTEAQREQIRVMAEAGDVAGAQRIILEELESQFGGAAEANATASQRMTVAWDNIKESVGTLLLPAFNEAAGAVQALSDWFSGLPETAQTVVLALTGVTIAAGVMYTVLGGPVTAIVLGFAAIGAGLWWLADQFPEAKKRVMEFFDDLRDKWPEIQKQLQPLREDIEATFNGFREFVKNLDFQPILDALKQVGDSLQGLKDQLGITSSNGQIAMTILGAAIMAVSVAIQITILAAMQAWAALLMVGAVSMKALQWGIAVVQSFLGAASEAAKTLLGWLKNLGSLNVSVPGLPSLRDILSSAADAARRLWDTLSSLVSKLWTIRINIPTPSIPSFSVGGVKIGGNERGTLSAPPGLSWVGESGPELIALNGGERIYPHERSVSMARSATRPDGTTITVNVNAGMGARGDEIGQAVVDALRRWSKTNGPIPVKVSA